MGPEGPEGPAGIVESHYVNIEPDQGLAGTVIGNNYSPTPTPAVLTAPLEEGMYFLAWSAEFMRTSAGAGNNVFVRLRDTTAAATRGFMKDGSGLDNGSNAAMPQDESFFALGDILPFSGSAVVYVPSGSRTYRLEYAIANSTSTADVLRVRRQRITLLRLD